jgi:hypothetical protein
MLRPCVQLVWDSADSKETTNECTISGETVRSSAPAIRASFAREPDSRTPGKTQFAATGLADGFRCKRLYAAGLTTQRHGTETVGFA